VNAPTCTLRLADVETQCSTRERGRRLYPSLLAAFLSCANREERLVIGFEGVELVTPSFLDETILRLVREQPRGEVTLTGIRDFPIQSRADASRDGGGGGDSA
jgi:hypothetical protein